MRRVRSEAGVSLRDLEDRGAWRRSTISQVETGKARPSRALIEWYDTELGSDGLLLSIYAEARSRQLLGRRADPNSDAHDIVQVIEVDPPAGLLVNRGARLQSRVTLGNGGTTTWRDRRLHRMGAHAGRRLIGSAPEAGVADTPAGELTDVVIELRAPDLAGSVVAYWSMIDNAGRECAPLCPPVAILLVVE